MGKPRSPRSPAGARRVLVPAWCGAALLIGLSAVGAEAQEWKTTTTARQYGGEKTLAVDVEYAAGRLRLEPAAHDVLYRTRLRYDARVFEPRVQYGAGKLGVSIGSGRVRGRNMKGGDLSLQVTNRSALDLELSFGAAEAELELGGLRLRTLSVETGASATTLHVSKANPEVCETVEIDVGAARFEAHDLGNLNARSMEVNGGVGEVVLDFGGEWRGDLDLEVSMGLGSLTLRVPRGLGVQIQKEGLLAGFDSQGLIKRGDVYYSENHEQAQHQLVVRIDAAFGSIKVEWTN